ncbi:hypothetical protein OROGR_000223 [Orobanche gracilis]
MVERNLHKTKLCMLYQRGRCSRQYCSFAHGSAELRRSSNGRQEYRGGRDLRERLDRTRSPLHTSPVRRHSKARHSSRGDSPRSHGERIYCIFQFAQSCHIFCSDRTHRKRKQLDGHTNYSGRMPDGNEDHQIKDRRQTSSDTNMRISNQLREMHSEIKILESHKQQLEMDLEDKVKEADILTLKIHELEMQLAKENEEATRYTAKIKKFVKAHNRHLRLQDELKRSHAQLQKLGEQLELDAAGPGTKDDSQIDTVSADIIGVSSPLNGDQTNCSPQRKRSRVLLEYPAALDQVNQIEGTQERTEIRRNRVEKLSRYSGNHDQLSNSTKPEVDVDGHNEPGASEYEYESIGGLNRPADVASMYKVSEMGLPLPPTGIAAQAMDEDVEVVDLNDESRVAGTASTQAETDLKLKFLHAPFLPPPPPLPSIPPNIYLQYKGDDENVDIDGVAEEMVEVDVVRY